MKHFLRKNIYVAFLLIGGIGFGIGRLSVYDFGAGFGSGNGGNANSGGQVSGGNMAGIESGGFIPGTGSDTDNVNDVNYNDTNSTDGIGQAPGNDDADIDSAGTDGSVPGEDNNSAGQSANSQENWQQWPSVSDNATWTVSSGDMGTYEGWIYTADESYFDDACFIGDSRTVGLMDYAGLDNATFYCSSGMNIYKIFKDPDRNVRDGNWKENIGTSLRENRFGKIYIMVGINELGIGDTQKFIDEYSLVLLQIRLLQPDAVIYVQSIMKVTEKRSEKGDYITNEAIDERNEALKELADNEHIFYIDINHAVCDETGAMCSSYTFDGVHLYAKYIDLWTQYLLNHTVR